MVSFGPGRMGFGLFLPTFRDAYGLSTGQAGAIASLGFFAFLVALPVAAVLVRVVSQRSPILLGALSATIGFALVAVSSTALELSIGIALAGASAGFCWTPFNDAVEAGVPEASRSSALSAVSTGTTFGVAGAGAIFLAVSSQLVDWRTAWAVFAAAAFGAFLLTLYGVPSARAGAPRKAAAAKPAFLRLAVVPLYATALCFGAANAIFLSFAADHVVAAGGLRGLTDTAAAAVIFLSYGAFGVVALASGRMEARFGLNPMLAAVFAAFTASLVLCAVLPGSWSAVVLAAGLHGAAVMIVSAIVSFWSLRLFPGRGSLGFTAALMCGATGSVVGPVVIGALAEQIGLGPAFLLAAAIPALPMLAFARKIGGGNNQNQAS